MTVSYNLRDDDQDGYKYTMRLKSSHITFFLVGGLVCAFLIFILGYSIGKNVGTREGFITEQQVGLTPADRAQGAGKAQDKEKESPWLETKVTLPEAEPTLDEYWIASTDKRQSPKPTSIPKAKQKVEPTSHPVKKGSMEPTPPIQAQKQQVKPKYTIQVAAGRNKEGAYKLKQDLIKAGWDSYITLLKPRRGGVIYRIRVGKYEYRDQAEKQLVKLKKNRKYRDAYILPYQKEPEY